MMASEFALQIAKRHCETTRTVAATRLANNVDAELREVRSVLSITADRNHIEYGHCWCRKDLTDDKEPHGEFCQRARALMEKLEVK